MDGSNASLDSTGKRKSFRRLCVRFAEKTSLQGVGYINNARLIGAKVVWVLLLLGAIGGMIFHLYFLFDQYFTWPVITKLSLGFNNLEMPSITICNTNAVKRSELNTLTTKLQQYVAQVDRAIMTNTTTNNRKKRFSNSISGVNASGYADSIDSPADNGKPPKNKLQEITETFRSLFMDNPRSDRIDSGHGLSDMLLSCSFDGRDCVASNFTRYPTAEYGNCFTLRAENFVATNSGPEYGLSLILYMQNEEYIHGITQGYGARVTIHQKNTMPFPDDNGFYTSTSFQTSIGLKLVDITRLPDPYGKCTDGADFKAKYNITYNRKACLVVCEQNAIISACNCFAETKDELFTRANILDYRPCRSTTEKTCQAIVEENYKTKIISCACDEPCSEQVFVKSISTRQWPSEDYAVALEQSICEKPRLADECTKLRSLNKRQLSLNFLKLDIYYESLNYELVEETPEIEDAQFASDVGGALGLWIGLSILSLFELVQLFVECCDYAHHRCTKRNAYRERQAQANRRNHRDPSNPKTGFNGTDRAMNHEQSRGKYNDERQYGLRDNYSDIGSTQYGMDRRYPNSVDYERERDGRYPASSYVYRGQRS
ncbi:amiloride-sensitive sodium channel subunit beta-like [Ylistrum balloti]|uniref:amiloride-sensitive sodium channel subunit beta-like n=1 Tax=Ylistrum balloti TaxID=509963 RepID=UPI002905B9B4|nr:amiloride-sensitive sodium channel subunit beta-like [Ylistrum balloti]